MKEKELNAFYKIFVNLYGAILHKDAFKIIKRFYKELTIEEFEKDLIRNLKKSNNLFLIKKWTKEDYIIRHNSLNNRETRSLLLLQANKPFFIAENLDAFKEFMFAMNVNKQTIGILRLIANLCLKYVEYYDSDFQKTLTFALAEDTQIYCLNHLTSQEVIERFRAINGIEFSKNDKKTFIELYTSLRLDTRTWEDRGFTGSEINRIYYNMLEKTSLVNKETGILRNTMNMCL